MKRPPPPNNALAGLRQLLGRRRSADAQELKDQPVSTPVPASPPPATEGPGNTQRSVQDRRPTSAARVQTHRTPTEPARRPAAVRTESTVNHGDLSVYRSPGKPSETANPTVPQVVLTDVLPDLSKLRIHLPESGVAALKQMRQGLRSNVPLNSSPATIGFDFGTAFTKVVVRWQDRHYPVDWSDAVTTAQRHLLPSAFCRIDGELALGRAPPGRGQTFEGLKLALLQLQGTANSPPGPEVEDAAVFMALALRYVRLWFAEQAAQQRAAVSSWGLNVGLPAQPWQVEPLRSLLQVIAQAALQVSEGSQPVDRARVCAALRQAASEPASQIGVIAEFAAQLASYMRAPQRDTDLHGLIDVGAGTVDFVTFTVHRTGGRDVLPIASSSVRRLGAHYLLGALVGRQGQDKAWHDSAAGEADGYFAARNNEHESAPQVRRDAFVREFRASLNMLFTETREWYRESRRLRDERLPVFLCGGGSNISQFRSILKDYKGVKLDLRTLPMPEDAEHLISPSEFHRMSVAYGLSLLRRNLAEVWCKNPLEPTHRPREIDFGDRDADR